MLLNPSKQLFLFTLVWGTLISISSNSWLGAWIGLEINLLSFIPIIMNSKNPMSTEAALKYFLIQAFASSILLFSFTLTQLTNNTDIIYQTNMFMLLMQSSLLLKMGTAPFHFWFPGTMEGLSWLNCIILMTWQKIAPLMLVSYLIKLNMFTYMIIVMSIIVGSIGGLNQTSLRKLMAYSSINHLGWMLSAMIASENLWMTYFIIYSIMSSSVSIIFNSFQISYFSQNLLFLNNHPFIKFSLFILLLSLGGLPPFLGFLPKWLVIQNLTQLSQISLITIMVLMTLITLFYYMRLTFSAFLLHSANLKWNLLTPLNNMNMSILSIATFTSMILLFLPTLTWITL
uniref:NADH-ubiquinone oxidoreductase chain 2 n=1 Tax=Phyllomimus sinicus TaxID=948398 RepID=A0A1Q1MPX7_9ORTH|nr:NADH dehydrogenase subunit 2 [Phyllomimus sinicus]AQM40135.1 NADH dehydrogenase subunit 2 [Phyllomimus sinicus]